MSEPVSRVLIRLYNKQLFTFLQSQAQKGYFDKSRLIMTSVPTRRSNGYPHESITTILDDETNRTNEVFIIDHIAGRVEDSPEDIYDVLPCLLIYLANMFEWDEDSFKSFRDSLLEESERIINHFDKVVWETAWYDNRYSWYDGIVSWTKKFTYDRFADTSEHIVTVNRWGVNLFDHYDEQEQTGRRRGIQNRSRYSEYDWNDMRFARRPSDIDVDYSDLDWFVRELDKARTEVEEELMERYNKLRKSRIKVDKLRRYHRRPFGR